MHHPFGIAVHNIYYHYENYSIYYDNHIIKDFRGCTELLQSSLYCTIPAPLFESSIYQCERIIFGSQALEEKIISVVIKFLYKQDFKQLKAESA